MIKKNIPIKHFFMLRHGESESNAAKIYSGQIDTPLTQKGREEAELAATYLKFIKIRPQNIIHSHLQRARDTAMPSQNFLGVGSVTNPDWAEQHYGDWQGVAHSEVKHLRDAGIEPPNGETNNAFAARIAGALRHTLTEYDVPLIVCHGGCFRAVSKLFDGKVRGSKNAILHEFIPSKNQDKVFPWDVFAYHDEDGMREIVEGYNE